MDSLAALSRNRSPNHAILIRTPLATPGSGCNNSFKAGTISHSVRTGNSSDDAHPFTLDRLVPAAILDPVGGRSASRTAPAEGIRRPASLSHPQHADTTAGAILCLARLLEEKRLPQRPRR